MTEFIHLKNYGFLQTRLPTDLFTKLKKECQNDKKLKEMKSGLSGKGVPKHFYTEEGFPELKEYTALYKKNLNFFKQTIAEIQKAKVY